jgi:hypothetical protein
MSLANPMIKLVPIWGEFFLFIYVLYIALAFNRIGNPPTEKGIGPLQNTCNQRNLVCLQTLHNAL